MLNMDSTIKRESPHLDKCMKRSNKPLMERRRRERINQSLNQLKYLVLEALHKDTSQYSKLEKADILEMAVQHLQSTHNTQNEASSMGDSSVLQRYTAGFKECASEVSNYLSNVSGLNPEVQSKLVSHLSQCARKFNASQSSNHHMNSYHELIRDNPSSQVKSNTVNILHCSSAVALPGINQGYTSERLSVAPNTSPSPPMPWINGSIYVLPNNNCQSSSYVNVIPQNNIAVDVMSNSSNASMPVLISPKIDSFLTPPPSPTDERLQLKQFNPYYNKQISTSLYSKNITTNTQDIHLWRPW